MEGWHGVDKSIVYLLASPCYICRSTIYYNVCYIYHAWFRFTKLYQHLFSPDQTLKPV